MNKHIQLIIMVIVFSILAVLITIGKVKAEAPSPIPEPEPTPAVEVIPLEDQPLEKQIEHYFEDEAGLMLAIFKAESSLNTKAKNYNCRYTREDGTRYSTSCKTVEDRANAWSVDCGLAQINHKGTVCPKELMDPLYNLEVAKKKRKEEGLKAWVVYTNGSYKKYLN